MAAYITGEAGHSSGRSGGGGTSDLTEEGRKRLARWPSLDRNLRKSSSPKSRSAMSSPATSTTSLSTSRTRRLWRKEKSKSTVAHNSHSPSSSSPPSSDNPDRSTRSRRKKIPFDHRTPGTRSSSGESSSSSFHSVKTTLNQPEKPGAISSKKSGKRRQLLKKAVSFRKNLVTPSASTPSLPNPSGSLPSTPSTISLSSIHRSSEERDSQSVTTRSGGQWLMRPLKRFLTQANMSSADLQATRRHAGTQEAHSKKVQSDKRIDVGDSRHSLFQNY